MGRSHEYDRTFFQIAAESGIIAGLSYILIVALCLLALWRNGKRLRSKSEDGSQKTIYWINEAALASFTGLVVCSLFLSLQLFEIFYLLCVMVNAILFIGRNDRHPVTKSTRDRQFASREFQH